MNSKVKQVLREGASVADIAAGLSYSVVKNCLYKVLQLKDTEILGDHIVVQGGTMRNDSIVRSLEKLTGKQVTVEGVCTHICRHGGRKIFLMGTDDTQVIRIEAGEKIGAFKPECVNNLVRVTGTLVEDRIDEAYLAEWEREVKDQLAEQHGEGEAGCSAEQQARGESVASSVGERIAGFRTRIADRKAKEGKEYLSFYHVEGGNYEVLE